MVNRKSFEEAQMTRSGRISYVGVGSRKLHNAHENEELIWLKVNCYLLQEREAPFLWLWIAKLTTDSLNKMACN